MAVAYPAAAYRDLVLRHLPTGDAWPRDDGELVDLAQWMGDELARVDQRLMDALREADPRQALEMLAEWEVETGLPDACSAGLSILSARRAAVVARLNEQRSPTPAAFRAIAAAYGLAAAVTEYRPHTTESTTEEPITDEAWAHVWDFHGPDQVMIESTTEDNTETPLAQWSGWPYECAVRRLAPAHTLVRFGTYQSEWDFTAGLPSGATLTRASAATRIGTRGELLDVAADAPRLDYDPAAPLNMLPNPWMDGGVAGTPGTVPTGFQISVAAGLSRQIVGFVEIDGRVYMDLRIYGTTTAASTTYVSWMTPGQGAAAVAGETWTTSFEAALIAGTSPANAICIIYEWTSGGTVVISGNTQYALSAAMQECAHTRVLNGATTARITGRIQFNFGSGVAVDFTLRVGAPTLTPGAARLSQLVDRDKLWRRTNGVPQHALRGLLVEPALSAAPTNPRAEGGSLPGTLPTGWSRFNVNAIALEVVGFGSEDGREYADLRWYGIPTTSLITHLFMPGATAFPVTLGEVLSGAVNLRLMAGSLAGVGSLRAAIHQRAAGGATVPAYTALFGPVISPTAAALRGQRATVEGRVTSAAGIAYATLGLAFSLTSGVPLDMTLRVALPRLERGYAASSEARPAVASPAIAPARAADLPVIAVPNGTYEADFIAGSIDREGRLYTGTLSAMGGLGAAITWPAAAIAAGERHLRKLTLRKVA